MTIRTRVAGVGMIPFAKPGQSEDWDVMAEKAVRLALKDAGLSYDQIQQAYVGYVYADSTAGQSALYRDRIDRTLSGPPDDRGWSSRLRARGRLRTDAARRAWYGLQ